jgi:O-antigen/teichoic acid export membrane protein
MAQKSIKKNYIFNLFYEVFVIIIPLITAPYVSRVLQADGVGVYSYSYSIATYFALLAALGTNSYAVREGARVRDDKHARSKLFYEITILRTFTTIVSLLVYLGLVLICHYDIATYLACGISVISVAFDCSWFLKSMENFQTLVLRNLIVKVVTVICIFTFVKDRNDLILYILFQTLSLLIANIVLIGNTTKYLEKVDLKTLKFKHHMHETLIYFIPTVATSVYTVLDKTMLGIIVGSSYENGYYEQTNKIINILLTLITSLSGVIGARTSYLFAKKDDQAIKKLIYKAFDFMILLACPLIAGVIGCANTLVPWFFGSGYDKVIGLLRIYCLLILIIGTSNILGGLYLTPSGQRKRSSKAIVTGSVVNLIFNMILIPYLSSYGAVLASIFAEGTITALYIYMSRKYVNFKIIFSSGSKYFLFSIIMFVPVFIIGQILPARFLTTLVQVIVGIGIYGILLLITKNKLVFEMLSLILSKLKKDNA